MPTYSYIHFYESKSINEIKKKDLINIRKLCNTFRFIDDLNSTNDGEEFKTNYDNIYPEELELRKENADKHEASFLDLDITTRDGEFQVVLFDKKDSFPFPTVRMPDESSNVPSNKQKQSSIGFLRRKGVLKVCSKFIGEHPCRSVISIRLQSNFIEITLLHGCSPVNLLHIFRTPFPKNFSGWLLKPLVTLKSRQGVSIEKISSVIQKFINKHQGYFETVCKSKQEQLHLVS